jgi:hypothetical protein
MELQELVDRLDRVSGKYSLLINIDKTKVLASDGAACHISIQGVQLEQVDTFPYLGSLITEDAEGNPSKAKQGSGNLDIFEEIVEESWNSRWNEDQTSKNSRLASCNIRM